jgi:hypothetical protein
MRIHGVLSDHGTIIIHVACQMLADPVFLPLCNDLAGKHSDLKAPSHTFRHHVTHRYEAEGHQHTVHVSCTLRSCMLSDTRGPILAGCR